MGPPGTLILEATPVMLPHTYVGCAWMGPPRFLCSCRAGHPRWSSQGQECRAGYSKWSSQVVVLEVQCGVALGRTGGPFHWEKPCGTSVSGAWNSWEPCRCWQEGLLLLMPLGSDARKGSVGRILLKAQGIKCRLEARGALHCDSHPVALPFTLPKPLAPSPPRVWEEPPKTPSVALLCLFGVSAN